MRMLAPGLSLSWPVVTTCSPAARPDMMATRSSRDLARLDEAALGAPSGRLAGRLALPLAPAGACAASFGAARGFTT